MGGGGANTDGTTGVTGSAGQNTSGNSGSGVNAGDLKVPSLVSPTTGSVAQIPVKPSTSSSENSGNQGGAALFWKHGWQCSWKFGWKHIW
ncbi:hypothetical protein BCR33DRAFT_714248 [Rhizoclosmatium globosum]|uniref:Uncharacterized protein n=1 Tax=Rhizoclosmatium globosum TaxID=329046 RepID=A0A1Y2CQ51_9FUNG|nr:hypothetical protein BCR33DRAFT_714248 [Rhizoclosmatium globosum]|eukprot:ORY48475.1 hypothetical protein BCR33DRAFT_714248 [Rhizoclosmatium globosum]